MTKATRAPQTRLSCQTWAARPRAYQVEKSTLHSLHSKKGQQEGNCDSGRFQSRTLRYSLRRVSPLDSVNRYTHNPKVGGSNPPPATNLKYLILRVFPSRH